MAKAMRFFAGAVLAATMAMPVLAEDLSADTVVASVNGTDITIGNLIVARLNLPEQYKTLPADVLFKGILDQLIQQTILAATAPEPLAKKDALQLENDRRSYLANVALTPVVTGAVTDEALQAAYSMRFSDAAPQTEYRAAHILVDSEEKAVALKAELDDGADFAALASVNSTDTGSGRAGGDLGWFGLGAMVKPFEDAVVAAELGKVSAPVKSDFGWHLILVQETRIADKPTLDELRDELAAQIEQKAVEDHIKTLTDAATIERKIDGVDPASIGNIDLLTK